MKSWCIFIFLLNIIGKTSSEMNYYFANRAEALLHFLMVAPTLVGVSRAQKLRHCFKNFFSPSIFLNLKSRLESLKENNIFQFLLGIPVPTSEKVPLALRIVSVYWKRTLSKSFLIVLLFEVILNFDHVCCICRSLQRLIRVKHRKVGIKYYNEWIRVWLELKIDKLLY